MGYSMGGRIALGLASSEKDLLYSLILESCNFGPEGNEQRAAAEERNAGWAQRLRNNGIEEFVEYWETLPLFESQREMGLDEELRPERLANDAESMALCLEGAGKHAMPDASRAFAVVASTWVPVKYLWGYDDCGSEAVAHQLVHDGIDVTSFWSGAQRTLRGARSLRYSSAGILVRHRAQGCSPGRFRASTIRKDIHERFSLGKS